MKIINEKMEGEEKMTTEERNLLMEDQLNRLELIFGLTAGLVAGLCSGLMVGLFIGLVYGLIEGLGYGLIVGLIAGIALGLVNGLIVGLTATLLNGLVTQVIAFLNSNPLFSSFDFFGLLVLLILIQVIGWFLVWNLSKQDGRNRKR